MGQGLSVFLFNRAVIALMRRMRPDAPASVAALARAAGAGESRARRGLALLRGRFGAAEESEGLWRLRFSPEWMDLSRLPRGSRIVDEVPSALDVARETEIGAPVFSEMQTRGRGRRGRRWLSVPAGAILFAMRFRTPKSPLGLPLAAGVGVLRALESCGTDLKLKWPNDLMDSAGRKAGGILVESLGASAVAGVGVNLLTTPELRAAIGRPVAGLVSDLNGEQHRNRRALAIAEAVSDAIAEFDRRGAAGFLPEALSRHIAPIGGEISFRGGDGRARRGEFAGFGERGELLLRGANGIEAHISGEFAEG